MKEFEQLFTSIRTALLEVVTYWVTSMSVSCSQICHFSFRQFWMNIKGIGLEHTATSWDTVHEKDDCMVSHKQFSSRCNIWHRRHVNVTQVDLGLQMVRTEFYVLLHAEAENSANRTASADTHCSNSEWPELSHSTTTMYGPLRTEVLIHELLHYRK